MSDLFFAPTEMSAKNLLNENKPSEAIYTTGNRAIDAMKTTISSTYTHPVLEKIGDDRLILVTAHRRENIGEPMTHMFRAIKRLVDEHDDVQVVYPVHLNPVVQKKAADILGDDERIHLIEPLNVI